MEKRLVIIKLGGSVITEKKSNSPVFKYAAARRISKEIAAVVKLKKLGLVIVHGAGSFGHPFAKKFKLDKGYFGERSSKGMSLTKMSVLELNLLIVKELINAGLSACLVGTSTVARTSGGKIISFDLNTIKNLLTKDLIPVLSGDVVIDEKKGISILSGDQIVSFLGKKLSAGKIIFVSDVDGIYDKNPKVHKNAQLIGEINNKNYKTVIKEMKIHNSNDVTGEMKGKILSIKENLKGIPVVITNGFKKYSVKRALLSGHEGTRILF